LLKPKADEVLAKDSVKMKRDEIITMDRHNCLKVYTTLYVAAIFMINLLTLQIFREIVSKLMK